MTKHTLSQLEKFCSEKTLQHSSHLANGLKKVEYIKNWYFGLDAVYRVTIATSEMLKTVSEDRRRFPPSFVQGIESVFQLEEEDVVQESGSVGDQTIRDLFFLNSHHRFRLHHSPSGIVLTARNLLRIPPHPNIQSFTASACVHEYISPYYGDAISSREDRWTLKEVQQVARHVLLALNHLHRHGFVHRNVLPESVFYSSSGIAVLGGFTHLAHRSESIPAPSMPHFTAPEVKVDTPPDSSHDIYSFGMMIAGMWLTEKHKAQVEREVLSHLPFWEECVTRIVGNEALSSFLLAALRIIPEERSEAGALLSTSLSPIRAS